jgi:hypothetical protein
MANSALNVYEMEGEALYAAKLNMIRAIMSILITIQVNLHI